MEYDHVPPPQKKRLMKYDKIVLKRLSLSLSWVTMRVVNYLAQTYKGLDLNSRN